jgi:hypothetical protein
MKMQCCGPLLHRVLPYPSFMHVTVSGIRKLLKAWALAASLSSLNRHFRVGYDPYGLWPYMKCDTGNLTLIREAQEELIKNKVSRKNCKPRLHWLTDVSQSDCHYHVSHVFPCLLQRFEEAL